MSNDQEKDFMLCEKLTLHHSQSPSRLSHTSAAWTASLYKQHGLSSHQAPGDWSEEDQTVNISLSKQLSQQSIINYV